MKNIRQHLYLAALLHDIGKFYQRADTGSVRTSHFLKAYCKEESSFCPLYNGQYSHKHVLWTAQFIDENRSVFQRLLQDDMGNLADKESLIFLAAGHHLSKEQLSGYGRIIRKADALSSGMDRDTDEARKDDQDEKSWDAFKKKRMVSLLQTIGQKEPATYRYIPVEPLTLSEGCFPRQSFDTDPDYLSLWNSFVGEFKFIQAREYHTFSETLLNLLFKYTTCIPASTIHFPDVSLYDHLKTTAALAVCLYDIEQSEEETENPFLLIGADFSGIQSYIYQIVSRYAGKNLKGRSFYLRLLSDAVVRYLLRELRLFRANVIYNSGGGFYLIAPNTSFVRKKLENAIEKIEEHLFRSHGTSLFVAIDSIAVSEKAFLHKGEHLGEVWGKLFAKRDRKKSCKFSGQITREYNSFFTPTLRGGDTARDTITGEEFLPGEKPEKEGELVLKKLPAIRSVSGKPCANRRSWWYRKTLYLTGKKRPVSIRLSWAFVTIFSLTRN
ncbi:MAG: type III-A CRISPR-associated protein Cas10/Csm1 [Bacteroides sp.]|nr:type III-A CRISPR-associated protein Cas10/Csm1 [Bacteroides sp.]